MWRKKRTVFVVSLGIAADRLELLMEVNHGLCVFFDLCHGGVCVLLTCEGDVEASVCVGVVRQELQSGHVAAGRYGWGQDVSGEGTEDGRLGLGGTQRPAVSRGGREEEPAE